MPAYGLCATCRYLLFLCLPLLCMVAGRGGAQLTPNRVELGKRATALVEQIATKGSGSAFCIDAQGLFITNQHVAGSAGTTVHLVVHPGEQNQKVYMAHVVRVDTDADLALLKVTGNSFASLPLGRSDTLRETMSVTAFGYPFGTALAEKEGEYPSITVILGHVSSLRKRNGVLQHIQLDASLNPGNSGGPVVNNQGEVVGVVQAGIPGSGIDLAIPVSHVIAFLKNRSADVVTKAPSPANSARPVLPAAPAPSKPPHPIPAAPPVVIAPPVLPAPRIEIPLPSEVDKVAIGGAGRYLILHLPKLRKLAIFDASAARIVGYLSLGSDDVLFTAGAEKVVVLLRDQNILQRWSLKTLEREANAPFMELDAINNMVMGAGSEGPLLVVSNSTSKPFLFYDILTMNRVPGEFHVLGFGGDESNAFALWASVDGMVFTASKPNTSPCEMFTMLFQGDHATGQSAWDLGGYAFPGMDGSFICSSQGVLSGGLKPMDPEHAGMMSCVPAFSSSYFLGVRNGGGPFEKNNAVVSLYAVTDRRLLLTLPPFPELNAPDKWGRDKLSLEKRLVFLPAANLIVTLADNRTSLVLRRFDLMEALNKADVDYLFVSSSPERRAKPGQHYRYAIETKSRQGGLQYKLDSGPKGMTLTPSGLLEWDVPSGYSSPMESIIVTIRDKSGQELFHTFQIQID